METMIQPGPVPAMMERKELYELINKLTSPHGQEREHALQELGKRRESVTDLAAMLWNSFGTVAALLQEIITVYPLLASTPPKLTAPQSNRVCNALALLQCMASHGDTRQPFLQAYIPVYLYPFLQTQSQDKPFEYLRLTSLGVIGALVKTDEPEVVHFLLNTEIIPLCLKIMDNGSDLSKTVATFIVQRILTDETGLAYVCQTFERFVHVTQALKAMILSKPSQRLLKHIVRCYQRLSEHQKACLALLQGHMPKELTDGSLDALLKDDSISKWMGQLRQNVDQARANIQAHGHSDQF